MLNMAARIAFGLVLITALCTGSEVPLVGMVSSRALETVTLSSRLQFPHSTLKSESDWK